ncbi:sodium:solute symporter [Enterobacter roggenkampii]|nr:sodium:solute symporter [Enterobacter roggenkampii]
MKKISELMMWSLFFSLLIGIGLTAGFYCFIGTVKLIARVIA